MNSKRWLFRLQYLFLPMLLILGLGAHAQGPLSTHLEGQGKVFAANETKKAKKTTKKHEKKAHKKPAKKSATKKAKKSAPHTKKVHKAKAHKTSSKKHDAAKKASHKAAIQHAPASDHVIGKRPDGKDIYEGPKGGQYYINDNGNKVYLPRNN